MVRCLAHLDRLVGCHQPDFRHKYIAEVFYSFNHSELQLSCGDLKVELVQLPRVVWVSGWEWARLTMSWLFYLSWSIMGWPDAPAQFELQPSKSSHGSSTLKPFLWFPRPSPTLPFFPDWWTFISSFIRVFHLELFPRLFLESNHSSLHNFFKALCTRSKDKHCS